MNPLTDIPLPPLPVDPSLVVDLIQKRSWIVLLSLVLGLAIRLLKDDSYIKNIPARARIFTVFGLGQVLGAVEAVIAGKTYKEAILWGVVQTTLAVLGHQVVIEGIRDGNELPVPFLTKPDQPSTEPRTPTVPPSSSGRPAQVDDKEAEASKDVDTTS